MANEPDTHQDPDHPNEGDKVVMHLLSGEVLKGTLTRFSSTASTAQINPSEGSDLKEVDFNEVKAIFIVKSYTGNKEYRERRTFGLAKGTGKRVMVRFKDGEILLGKIKRSFPVQGGSLAVLSQGGEKGFTIHPADPQSNNTKVFVVFSALIDVRYL